MDAVLRQQGPRVLRRQRRQQPRISLGARADGTRRTGRSTGRSPDRTPTATSRTWTMRAIPARFAMTSVVYEEGKLPGYEGQLISGMALTSRMQATRFVADGSTFRTVDTDAVVTTADRSFRPVDTAVGPDGAIYIADWCDIRMDHTDPRDTWDKSCGRIWRLRAKDYRPVAPFDLAAAEQLRISSSCSATPESGTANRHGGCSANAEIARWFPQLRRLARDGRGQLALEALWTANLISGMDSDVGARPAGSPRRAGPILGTAPVECPRDRSRGRCTSELVRLARTEPDAEVRSELANTAGRLEPRDALAVLHELIRRQEDVADKHIPLRIWWALEDQITSDADVVSSWLEEGRRCGRPRCSPNTLPAASRGGWPPTAATSHSFTRIDPDNNWKDYAQHPRSLMPGGKGTIRTGRPTTRRRSATETSRGLRGCWRWRPAQVTATGCSPASKPASSRAHGPGAACPSDCSPRLSAQRPRPVSRCGRGHGGARPGGVPDLLRALSSDRRQRHGASRAATARVPVGARIGRSAHPNRAAWPEGTAGDAGDGRPRRSTALRHPHLRAQGLGPFGRTGCR